MFPAGSITNTDQFVVDFDPRHPSSKELFPATLHMRNETSATESIAVTSLARAYAYQFCVRTSATHDGRPARRACPMPFPVALDETAMTPPVSVVVRAAVPPPDVPVLT